MSVLSRFSAPLPHANLSATTDKFTPFLNSFLADLSNGNYVSGNRTIRLLAHSHESKVTRALLDKASELNDQNVKLELILSDLPIALDFENFLSDIEPLLIQKENDVSFRWAQNRLLLDAHEQVILGDHSSWSGDTLKRSASNAYHVDMFDVADEETIRLGKMAFSAMWMASVKVPAHRLKRISQQDGSLKHKFLSQLSNSLIAGKWSDGSSTCH